MTGAGRRWLELAVRCPSAGDRDSLLADALISMGARGVVERGAWYVAYFAEPEDADAFLAAARVALGEESGLDDILVEHAWQEHEDWAESWKRGLRPRRVTDRIVVHPSWAPPDDVREGDIVIVLDPGMAFGTAEHGTTRGCLGLLDRVVSEGDRVLDVGAGSGILAIAAAKLGARHVVAIEGDPLACEAMKENVVRNGVADRVRIVGKWATGDDLTNEGPASGIVANLETGLLEPLFAALVHALAPGGWLVVSGILGDEWENVRRALTAHDLCFVEAHSDGDWRTALFTRRARAGA